MVADISSLYINFGFFMCTQRCKVSGSCGSFSFSILRKLQTHFHRYYANLHSHQQNKNNNKTKKAVFFLPISYAFIVCFLDGSLTRVGWNFIGSFDLHFLNDYLHYYFSLTYWKFTLLKEIFRPFPHL